MDPPPLISKVILGDLAKSLCALIYSYIKKFIVVMEKQCRS